jgi:hypothetical protein
MLAVLRVRAVYGKEAEVRARVLDALRRHVQG